MSNLAPSPTPRLVLDKNLARMIGAGVQSLFSTTFGINIKSGDHFVTADYQGVADVSGHIGMIQDELEGSLTVSFPESVILPIMSKAYQHEFKSVNKSVRDGVGEITNIVYALLKKSLNEKGFRFRMSVPQVIVGKGHEVHHLHEGQSLVIPFSCSEGEFVVFVTIQPSF